MTSKKHLWLAVAILVFASAGQTSAGPNANAVVSLDLIADAGAGNRTDDGITSGVVSGQGTTIAVEIFATGVRTSLLGMVIEFEFDASLLSFVKAENSAFYLTAPEGSIGIQFAARNPVTLASSGYLARAEFETVSDVTATEFSIGIGSVTLAQSMTSSDELIATNVIRFNASPSPDFDGDDFVGFSDLLIFARGFGSHQGDGGYNAVVDLNSDGEIGFIDLLLFAESFGAPPPSTGGGNGGSPDLAVQSPSVNDNTLTTGQLFTLRATVRNRGNASSASTTLQYYRSTDGTISTSDTQVGTDAVSSLSAGGASAESISLNAPSSAGTYYYGACVESVSGESNTGNNCSSGVSITVSGSSIPDLIVESPSVNDNTLTTGQLFTLRATVRNRGNASSASTTLQYYRSTDGTISTSDTQVGTDAVSSLSAGGASAESISLNAPSDGGTFYYGACVESVSGESNTENNCSSGVSITVSGSSIPDLIVESPSVNDNTLTTGQSFTLRATVRNRGNASSASTTLQYYRSTDGTISTSDTQVGTDAVSSLSAGGASAESISLNAPSDGGTFYYGACVESVSGESNTENNCSSGVNVTVSASGSPDLIVESPSVNDNTLTTGQSFTLGATVRNRGNASSASTTLRYYRSTDGTISTSDTQVGTDAVSSLSAGGTSAESISLNAPSSAGTYYYGACVENVSGESITGNNCSDGVSITVATETAPGGRDANRMYWTDTTAGKIQRSNLDGSGVETLVTTGLEAPIGIALDVAGGKMYWTDPPADRIQRSNLDGSNVENLVTTGLEIPVGIALDVAGGKMYWTDNGTDKIQRSNLDGSGVETLVATGLSNPRGIALDAAGGKMYWTDKGTDKIQRSNLDGSSVETLVATGLRNPQGIALDVAGGKMYWADYGEWKRRHEDKIQRSNLNGSGVETLVTTGIVDPWGIALDVAGGKMYWTDWETGRIHRSNLDGSGVENLVTRRLFSPRGIALEFAHVEAGKGSVVPTSATITP